MARVIQTATSPSPLLLVNKGSDAALLINVNVGETIESENTAVGISQLANIDAVVNKIQELGLTPSIAMLDAIPVDDKAVALRGLNLPLYEENFSGMIGSLSSANFISNNVGDGTNGQAGGVRTSLNIDSQGLLINGFSSFFVLRPPGANYLQSTLLTSDIPTKNLSQVTINIVLGSCGTLEPNDRLSIYAVSPGSEEELVFFEGNTPRQDLSIVTLTSAESMQLKFVSELGEGNMEGFVIERITVS